MRALACLLLVATALAAPAAPASAQSGTAPSAFTVEYETALTADGVQLGVKRLKVAGGVPILMLHGLGANSAEWDLPSKSLGRYLAGLGYDVWMANHRRVGPPGFRSVGGRAGYSFDDLAALDTPALVARVRAATGERPFLVGHSMGGMMAEAWLAGAAYESVPVRRRLKIGLTGIRWEDVLATRMTGSAARAAQRNAEIRGLAAIASPVRFKWPAGHATIFDFWRHNFWDYNILLRDLSWSPAGIAAAYAFDHVPAGEIANVVTDDLVNFPYVGPQLRPFLSAVTAQVGRSFLSSQIMYGPNMEPQVTVEGLDEAVDDSSGGVFLQLMDGIREKSFRDAHVFDPIRRPYIYADHLGRITAPAFLVGGRYDKLCNDDTLFADGFSRLGSQDKTYLALPAGHVDLVIGRDAPRDLWAPLAAWLAARR